MNKQSLYRSFVVTLFVLGGISLSANAAPDSKDEDSPVEYQIYPDESSVTYHSVEINGEVVNYEATAGTITLAKLSGKQEHTAKMFYISYRKVNNTFISDVKAGAVEPSYPDTATRPVTFSFNGGPGSSSVWLHLGIFGPKRVNPVDDFGNPGQPPYLLVDNEFSLLDQSDFVFIDPVSTGFSRAAENTSPKDFHGVNQDIRSVAEFIRIYLTQNERWRSPRYIAGESYGTTRAAGLADELHDTHGISLNGVILVSAIMNFQTARFDIGNDLPYPLFLPTFAATGKFHNKLSKKYQSMELTRFLKEVETFALNEYTLALAQGDQLDPKAKEKVAQRISEYTGLSKEYVLQANLRVNMPRFPKELLRDEGKTVGRFDSRFTGVDREVLGNSHEFDPSYAAIRSIYTEGMNALLREDLNYKSDMRYEILTNVWPWSFRGVADNQYLNTAERLRQAMHVQPHMTVFVANGYYDLATPYFATQYTIDHMFLSPELKDQIKMYYYDAGHMMYAQRDMLKKLKDDLDAYYISR